MLSQFTPKEVTRNFKLDFASLDGLGASTYRLTQMQDLIVNSNTYQSILSFLDTPKVLAMQVLSKKLYDEHIPNVMSIKNQYARPLLLNFEHQESALISSKILEKNAAK